PRHSVHRTWRSSARSSGTVLRPPPRPSREPSPTCLTEHCTAFPALTGRRNVQKKDAERVLPYRVKHPIWFNCLSRCGPTPIVRSPDECSGFAHLPPASEMTRHDDEADHRGRCRRPQPSLGTVNQTRALPCRSDWFAEPLYV